MARLPGLTAFEDDAPQPGRRIQPRQAEIDTRGGVGQMPRLRPVANPVDTYSRPAAEAPADKQLMSLADALGGLNTALQRYGAVAQQKQEKDSATEVQRRATTETPEAFEAWKQANPDKVRTIAAQEVLGRQAAIRSAQATEQEYIEKFDKDGGDINEFLRARQAADLEGKSPEFQAVYMQTMGGVSEKIRGRHQQYIAGRTTETIESGLISIYQQAIDSAISEGKSPEEAMAAIRQRRAGDAKFNGIPYARQDELLVEALRAHGEGKGGKDFIEGILNLPGKIVHSDGREQDIGPLGIRFAGKADTARNAARQKDTEVGRVKIQEELATLRAAAEDGNLTDDNRKRLLEWQEKRLVTPETYQAFEARNRAAIETKQVQAERARIKQGWQEHYDTQVTQSTLEAADAVKSNRASGLREVVINKADAQGNPVTERIAAKDRIKAATDYEMRRIDEQERTRAIQPEVAFDQRVAWHANAGTKYEPWEVALSRAGAASLKDLRENNGKPSEATMAGYELYTRLRKNPALLDRHISKDTRDLFDLVDAHWAQLGEKPEEAFTSAFAAMQMPAESRQAKVKDIDSAIKGIRQDQWFGMFGGKSIDAVGNGYVQRTVRDMAGLYAQTMPVADAVKAAAKRFNETHTIVLGSPIMTKDFNIPEWFGTEVEEYAKWFADRDKSDDVTRASDLTIRRIEGSGAFQLLNKKTGLAVGLDPDNGGLPSAFTMDHLMEVRTAREDRKREQIVKEAEERRNEPTITQRIEASPAARTASRVTEELQRSSADAPASAAARDRVEADAIRRREERAARRDAPAERSPSIFDTISESARRGRENRQRRLEERDLLSRGGDNN